MLTLQPQALKLPNQLHRYQLQRIEYINKLPAPLNYKKDTQVSETGSIQHTSPSQADSLLPG
jgi:hypothetical protein